MATYSQRKAATLMPLDRRSFIAGCIAAIFSNGIAQEALANASEIIAPPVLNSRDELWLSIMQQMLVGFANSFGTVAKIGTQDYLLCEAFADSVYRQVQFIELIVNGLLVSTPSLKTISTEELDDLYGSEYLSKLLAKNPE